MAIWFSVETPEAAARFVNAWGGIDAPTDEIGAMLLEIAREQVLDYAPSVSEELETTEVYVRLTYVNGEVTDQALTWSADDLPADFTGTQSFPLSARGLRLETVYEDGEPVSAVLTTAPEIVPQRYVMAQLQQAKNLWNAGRGNSDGSIGSEGYSFQPRPLDKTIRQMIRPSKGVADVF